MPNKKITAVVGSDGTVVALALPRITDYFERDQVEALSTIVDQQADPASEAQLLAQGVLTHVEQLTDAQIVAASISMLEDLYRTMASAQRVHIPLKTGLDLYLRATAGTLTTEVRRRGYVLQYLVDNQFPEGGLGPAAVFPLWFKAAGFIYVSPREAGLLLMEHDGKALQAFDEFWPRYEVEGRAIAVQLWERAATEGRSVVVIDDEPEQEPLRAARRDLPRDGVVGLFRNEPPNVKGLQIFAPSPLEPDLRRLYGL